MHPGSKRIVGRDAVMASWDIVLQNAKQGTMRIACEGACVVADKGVGVVTCTEVTEADDSRGLLAATNVFQKQNGRWKMIHHQAGSISMQ